MKGGAVRSFPIDVADDELLLFVDGWAMLLEREDYEAAFAWTGHVAQSTWTADFIRQVIKGYGDANPGQKVTLDGIPSDVSQRKIIDRWADTKRPTIGQIWYDLNIDGLASDLTATFDLYRTNDRISILLDDVHVM